MSVLPVGVRKINGMVPCPMKLWAICKQIKDSGELVVLTLYSSTSYFNYRGQEMGFQYELSEQFAKSLGVKLRVVVARNVQGLNKKVTGRRRRHHCL